LYTDPVYAQFILLTQDARLSIGATTELAKRLALAGTENERLNVLAEERRGYHDVIVGGATSPSRAAKLRQSLGYLIGAEDPDELAEKSPDASESHVKTLIAAADRLNKVIAAQQRVEQSRLHRGE
jgi:hypothetical protein